MRKACTEQDYYETRTACDNDHKVWGHCFEKKYIKQFILIVPLIIPSLVRLLSVLDFWKKKIM